GRVEMGAGVVGALPFLDHHQATRARARGHEVDVATVGPAAGEHHVLRQDGGEIALPAGPGLETPDDHGELQIGHDPSGPLRPGARARPGLWNSCLDGVGIVLGDKAPTGFLPTPNWELLVCAPRFPRADRIVHSEKGIRGERASRAGRGRSRPALSDRYRAVP